MANEAQILRVPPSGPPILNANGGPAGIGPGFRTRLIEHNQVMAPSGNTVVPTVATSVGAAGFVGDALALALDVPNKNLNYRARVAADIANVDTNDDASVQFILETSVDEGVTWTTRATNVHKVGCATDLATDISNARGCELILPKTLGSVLGITDDTETLLLRVQMASPLNPALVLDSRATPSPNATGSQGTFHFELEEVM